MTAHNNYMPSESIRHLTTENWDKATLLLLRKTISEFAHEFLLLPELTSREGSWGNYKIRNVDKTIEYRFQSQILNLNHWNIKTNSIQKYVSGQQAKVSLPDFILEFQENLGIAAELLPTYLEEITSTIYSKAYMIASEGFTSEALADQDYQTIEHAMTEGHPCFVANSGRIGFNAIDYDTYAPEAFKPIQLLWLAGHKSRAVFSGTKTVDYSFLIQQELDQKDVDGFDSVLAGKGLDSSEYYYFPVHPWQWHNKLALVFAADIAENLLVYLGYGSDSYAAQQSIRTFFNTSHPEKFYAKTALSILNMGFMRGLSPYYMESTPVITEWIAGLVENDPYLQQKGFTLLGEVATLGYRNFLYEKLGRSIPHNKMLATLWRESPIPKLNKGQNLMTMAALLHVDQSGKALVPYLIQKSGLTAGQWVKKYLEAYLSPLIHCFYHHEMVFMPHGENLILVMENHTPVKTIMKDITEEVMVFNPEIPLPEKAKRIYVDIPEELKILCIFNDVFDFYFRFLAHILYEQAGVPEHYFWKWVADCINDYQAQNPQLANRFRKYDLFMPEFDCCCLNRLQLKNNKQMLDLAEPVKSLQFVGKLTNPIAVFKLVNS
ncbi:IucA/IucC family protein [Flavobacterium humi]|uniref:IucA/IucC family siderophore biosynthesis protein n=1 Tax=Flavobacterium humi TaxID=2562683 RepID=A0A4Z0L463_9FLAO|nr:IucA/IucC family siderophore biosynthesis protein [Flavobacterium humi]TGD57019.1 IucA/IucC family siderophore biosynthesis protein [Flavobacterium humi]